MGHDGVTSKGPAGPVFIPGGTSSGMPNSGGCWVSLTTHAFQPIFLKKGLIVQIEFIALLSLAILSGCQADPIEKCVQAQIRAAEEVEADAVKALKQSGRTVDWMARQRPTLVQVEASARIDCLRAATGKAR